MIKLEYLKVFLAVAETHSLALAADRVGRTASAVSMTLKQLEEELGAPLFVGERKNQLTPLGAYVAERAHLAIREHELAIQHILRFAKGEEGVVRLATVPSLTNYILPLAVKRFQADRKVLLEIRDIDSASVAQAVTNGTVDFGVASQTASSLGLTRKNLISDQFYVICPASHPLCELNRDVSWQDLVDFPFIANGLCVQFETPELRRLVENAPLFVHNMTSLLSFISKGFGVSILPQLSFPQSKDFVQIPLQEKTANRHLYLFYRPGELLSPGAKAFADEIEQQAKDAIDLLDLGRS